VRYLRGHIDALLWKILGEAQFPIGRRSRDAQSIRRLTHALRELVRDWGVEASAELIQEMIVNLRSGTCLDRFLLPIATALDVFAS
jgi:hypothetical protein